MIRRVARDVAATSAVEFALCLPFLITLYVGSYQICDAISAYRKVTTATRAVADLTSQYPKVSNADLDSVLQASQQIMAPYKLSDAKLTVTQVQIDDSGKSTVDWSRGLNISGLKAGASFEIPPSIKVNGTYLIIGSIDYKYVPIVASGIIGPIPMHDQIILSPRTVPFIPCDKCNPNA